ncbi:MAG: Gfo/Idh/MocA family oxidoreductase, partial [Acidimicrobiia bacterium]
MQVALIGAGRIGTNHAGILAAIDGVDSLLIADLAHERAVELAESISIASAVDVDAAFTADAIVIASSTDTHADLLIRTAEAGIPAFCEKPIALDLASTRRAVEAVEQAGTAVQMG